MDILLFLILVFILFPLLKIGFSVWKQVHNIKRAYNQQYQRQSADSSSSYRQSRSNDTERSKHHRNNGGKIFSKSDGQYVEFEEIIEDRQSASFSDEASCPEPQINDVEFEEIK